MHPTPPLYIETLPRRGYRFIAKVEFLDVPEADTPAPDSKYAAGWRRHRIAIGTAALALVLFLVATAFFLRRGSTSAGVHADASPMQQMRVLTRLADETSDPAFSPDGRWIAFERRIGHSSESAIVIQPVNGSELVPLTKGARDCCPVWSPDGRALAFTREEQEVTQHGEQQYFSLHIVQLDTAHEPFSAGAERQVSLGGADLKRPEVAWSPDGKSIAFSSASGVSLLSLDSQTARRVTEAPPSAEDWGPSFAPDGARLLFVRSHSLGYSDDVMSVAVSGGEPTQIASEHAHIMGPPQWSSDGRSVLYSSDRGSHPGLWRVSAVERDSPVLINDTGWYPSVSRQGHRLAYQRIARSLNIWARGFGSNSSEPHILIPAVSETDQGPGPQISPDDQKIAFMSDRSGTMEIWVSDRDGSNARQVTSVGVTGTPRWSPDGQSLVFDVGQRNGVGIYVAPLQGGAPRALVQDNSSNVCPSWSRDGKWIYFASTKSGSFQIWRVLAAGGTPEQLTHSGGHASLPSADGRVLYYAKNSYANPEIWQIPVNGGPEKPVSPTVRPFTWASWAVTQKGIVFASSGNGRPVVRLFDTRTHRISDLGIVDMPPFWLSAAPDASWIAYDQPGWQQAQLVLVENFR